MISVLVIAILTVLCFIFSILLFPQVSVGTRRIKLYPIIPLVGGVCMLAFGGVHLSNIIKAFTEDSSVNPIRIFVLFFSMTIFSLLLDETGFFEHISGVILQKAGHSQHRIFLSLYSIISLLTVFTSNDIVILTFTPFICHFCKAARIDAVPYLIMEFVAANTWSLLLLIGNPTNIYISGAFEIGFLEYMKVMALPTVAAGMVSLLVMALLFRKKLAGEIMTHTTVTPIHDRPMMWIALLHLGGCVMLLTVSQYIGLQMWLITLAMAVSAVLCSALCLAVRRKGLRCVGQAIAKMPYEIIPFILGMFVIVLALEESGLTAMTAQLLSFDHSVFSYGILSFFASNILNNIPMSVLFSKILNFGSESGQIYATIIGSNLGAFLTPVGALAGIMWLNLLKQNKIKLSTLRFVVLGGLIGIPAIMAALFVLQLSV